MKLQIHGPTVDVTDFPYHSTISHAALHHTPSHRPHPTPFICQTADDPPVLFSPHIHLGWLLHQPSIINMHKKCASLSPTIDASTVPVSHSQNKSFAHQYIPAAAITLLMCTTIQTDVVI